MDRRQSLKALCGMAAACAVGRESQASSHPTPSENSLGVLVDTTVCIGCRKCEWACNDANQLPTQSIEAFEDKSVFAEFRHPDGTRYTVVNHFDGAEGAAKPNYVKSQCMHCNDPACVSACLVRALEKQENGAVSYNADRCMGCRYCMIACPFQANGYEYQNALTPRVMKCTLCLERISKDGGVPACVEICPPQCLTFGKRSELLALAKEKINRKPDHYIDHVFGEHEVGGTSWLYLANREFTELGFPTLPDTAPPRTTETIQHGVFKYFIPPVALYLALGGIMKLYQPLKAEAEQGGGAHEK